MVNAARKAELFTDLSGEEFDPDDYDLGAELLEDMDYSERGADAFAGYIGDVGRDPFGSIAND